jgi:hypothetical protein
MAEIFESVDNYVNGNTVQLNWETINALRDGRFEIERSISLPTGEKEWQKIGEIDLFNHTESKSFLYTDNLNATGKFSYRIKFEKAGGQIYSQQIDAEILPTEFVLYQNYPNPFNPVTNIKFSLPQAGRVRLDVYNIIGEQVVTLIDKEMEAGFHNITLDGKSLTSGTYIYRIQTKDFSQTRKMLLLK